MRSRALLGALAAALSLGGCVTATADPVTAPPTGGTTEAATTPAGADEDETTDATGATASPPGFVVWARGGLPAELGPAAATLPGVLASTVVPSDTIGLTGSRRADGTAVDDLPDGWRIPVDAAAVDPVTYAATLPTEVADDVARLRPGEVVLSESSAVRRRLGVGDRLDLEDRTDLVVRTVLPDDVLTRAEVLVHRDDGDALGLGPEGTLFVETDLGPGPEREALAAGLAALLPAEATARVVDLAETRRERRRAPLVLSLADVKDRFGEFAFRPAEGRAIEIDPDWVDEHIVDATVPILGTVRCHREIVAPLREVLQRIEDTGAAATIDPARYAGCFNARRISEDRARLSRHAWGIALDLNVDLAQPGGGEVPDPALIEAFAAGGFVWGGEFLVPDNHHYEFVGAGWPLVSDD